MSIVDEENLLTDEEQKAFEQLLKLHGYEPYHFLVEVTEDQGTIDMNDINYVIILKVKVTHVQNDISNTYYSQLGSRTWISEFEDDLLNKYYVKST
jgi:hypothetical protein